MGCNLLCIPEPMTLASKPRFLTLFLHQTLEIPCRNEVYAAFFW